MFDNKTLLITIIVLVILLNFLLLLLVFMLARIWKKQHLMLDSIATAMSSIDALQNSILEMDSTIVGNFKTVFDQNMILSSNQATIVDRFETLNKGVTIISGSLGNMINAKVANPPDTNRGRRGGQNKNRDSKSPLN